jgi:hypothetical protein
LDYRYDKKRGLKHRATESANDTTIRNCIRHGNNSRQDGALMKRRIILTLFFAAIGLGAIATAVIAGTDLESRCIFLAFAAIFFVFAAAPWLGKKSKPTADPTPPAPTRFVPHWFMLLAILLLVILLVAGVISLF